MFTVYAIYNKIHGRIYIGQTKDLEVCITLHNNHALGGYTSRFDGEWEVIYKEEVRDRKEALAREKMLKGHQGREFVKQYIPR